MKRVLIFSTNYLPFVGGAEIAVKEITDRLPDIRFDMVVPKLVPDARSFERIGNVSVYRVGLGFAADKFFMPFLGLARALTLHRKNHYHAIWSIMASQAGVAAAFFKMLSRNVFMILTLQEGDEEEHLARYVGGNLFLYRLMIRPWHLLPIRTADMITVISSYLKDRAVKNGAHAPIEVVPNGVDVERFMADFAESTLQALKDRLGISYDSRVLITTSRLVKKNAVVDIILALRYLPMNVTLLIIGDGDERNGLQALAEKNNVANRLRFLGSVSHALIPQYLHISDIFIRPSLSEGMGNSFIEAMAAGIPVIATPVGGITDFLLDPDVNPDNEPTGLFCQVRNPESIARQVERLMHDVTLRERITANALELVSERYDWSGIADQMAKRVFGRLDSNEYNGEI